MQILINFIIFIIVLFFYIHINFQLNTSDDLEIYEVDEITKERLEDLCNIKQPILFKYYSIDLENNLNLLSLLENYKGFDINLRNIKDYTLDDNTFIPINLQDGYNLFTKDFSNTYISESNTEFINETTLYKKIISNDIFLRPYLCSNCQYDIIFGSKNSYTPLRYNLNSRNYIYVVDGEIEIMLTVPNNYKYLEIIKDYANFEFRSKYNPYNDVKEKNLDKIKFLTITMKKNDIIYIPFKWIYTLKILDSKSIICSMNYSVIMNTLAILPEIFLQFLQNKNIKHNFLNKIEFK